jgi:hypothetical protein
MADEIWRDPHSMHGVVPQTMMWYFPMGERLNIV